VERDDVRVAELRRRLGFAKKPLLDVVAIGEFGREDLDRDAATEFAVQTSVDHPHTAAADFPANLVSVAKGGGYTVAQCV
jgi:hypothetical protein